MTITLTEAQLELIYHYDKTKSVVSACHLAKTLVAQVLAEEAKEFINEE